MQDTKEYARMYLLKRGFTATDDELNIVSNLMLDYMVDRREVQEESE